jgi:hypothetical protein
VVWHIGTTGSHVFLYTATAIAFVVPHRAFRDRQHLNDFVALARQYQQGPRSTGIIADLPQSTAIARPDAR